MEKLKSEWIYGNEMFSTRKDAEKAVLEYIEVFYNRERLYQALGYCTPMEFEQGHYLHKNALDPRRA